MADHWERLRDGGIQVSNNAEELWQNAISYFEYSKKNPIIIQKVITSGKEAGRQVNQISIRPLTVEGLCLYCGIEKEYLQEIRNSKDKTSMYYIVVSRILYSIYVHNAEMALIGEYNSILVSKMLNMDKEEQFTGSIKVELIGTCPPLSSSENEVLEKLEMEKRVSENREL